MNLYEGIKNNLNEMGNFASRMDTLRAAGDRANTYRQDVVNQKNKKVRELFDRLKEIQGDVAELKEIGKHINLYKLKDRYGMWLDASDRGLDYENSEESRETLHVDTDKILMSEPYLSTSEITADGMTKPNPFHHKNTFIKLATEMLDNYPGYIKAVNQMIDDYDLKYPELQESVKLKEAGKALGRGLEDLISTSEDVSGLNKVVGSDSTSLNSREGFKEIYGEDASYTDIRKIVEELEAINEQAAEDGFNFTDKFATIITDLSSICADIEDFYEHR